MTAEEFIREKIRQKFELKGSEPINALWMYNINGDEALRWIHEFAELKLKENNPK